MKILVAGSRYWRNEAIIEAALSTHPKGTILIHGDCKGVDRIAASIGERLGFVVRAYPAIANGRSWPSAGPLRNQEMLDQENIEGSPIDQAIVFHEDASLGKGTRDMHNRLVKAGIPVKKVIKAIVPHP